MKLLSPPEYGLPEQFDHWRPTQEHAMTTMLECKKRVMAVCAPTGLGKSLLAVGAAKISNLPTCIVTNSKGLQNQYLKDFQSVGMVDIRGKKNYTCDMKEDYTCEEGHASRCPYMGTVGCPYSQAGMRAATSSLVVTNYDKWIAAKRFGQGMEHFKQIILDEAHDSFDALSRALQISLSYREIEENLKLDAPKNTSEFSSWKTWAPAARAVAEVYMKAAHQRITEHSDPKPSWVKHYTHMRNLVRRLAVLSTARATDWVVDDADKGFVFDPIRPGKYAESNLLLKVEKIIMLSATLRPKSLFMLGIGKENFDYIELNSEFDPKRSPIYYIPTMRVDERNRGEMATLWIKLDQIAARRRDRKGLVHTVSFPRQKEIKKASRFGEYMLINDKGDPPTEMIEEFKQSGAGTILVSPSIGTGYDFPDDEARWQFMAKIPFDPPSKIVKAREADDKEYRGYRAMQKLVQAFGRINRSKKDWGESFICDQHIDWFMPRYGHLAPKAFHNFFRKVDVVPLPPQIEAMK